MAEALPWRTLKNSVNSVLITRTDIGSFQDVGSDVAPGHADLGKRVREWDAEREQPRGDSQVRGSTAKGAVKCQVLTEQERNGEEPP